MCPLVTGNISRNAYVSSSSYILFDLISPETILQNKQSIICVCVWILFRFYFDRLPSIIGRNLFIVGHVMCMYGNP